MGQKVINWKRLLNPIDTLQQKEENEDNNNNPAKKCAKKIGCRKSEQQWQQPRQRWHFWHPDNDNNNNDNNNDNRNLKFKCGYFESCFQQQQRISNNDNRNQINIGFVEYRSDIFFLHNGNFDRLL